MQTLGGKWGGIEMNRPSGRGRTLAAALIAAAVLPTRLLPAAAQKLAKEPAFALNTPYHAGFVLRLAVAPDERQVVTAGFDKTVRVWDARTGELLRRHFLPVRDAADGRVTAAALSPDGERLALGGGLHGFGKGKAVIVVSLADGRIADVVGVFNLSARTVSWSRDGAVLAVGMDGHEGPSRIHVFEAATWSKVFEDRQVRGRVDAIKFRRDGAFVAVTNNGTIDSEAFLYRPEGKTFRRVAKKSFGVRGAMRAAWTAAETHLYVGGHSYLSGEDLAESAWPAGGRPPPATPPGKGTLHVLAIGVSDYDNAGYRLGLAAKDARDFGLLMAGQQGRRYDEVEATVLADKAAGKESMERALSSLRAKVRAQDTTFVFLAGHGINDEAGEYLYLPREADLARLGETAVSFRLLRQILTSLPGRTLLFVDTCHAGNALGTLRPGLTRDNIVAINELASAENNIIVFASSTGAQESMEDAAWGNGAFTKALLEGLKGAADFKRRGRVTYKQLDAYVADRVEELT
jgi:hypothetical protein